MAEADKDGRMAQIVRDLHATLAMSLHESVRDKREAVTKALDEVRDADEDDPRDPECGGV